MDTSRLTPLQIQMQMNKIRHEQEQEQSAKEKQDAQDRASTQNGTGYRNLHDILKSDFHKTTVQTLNNNRKKEYLQRHFNTTVDDLDSNQLNDFVKTVSDT